MRINEDRVIDLDKINFKFLTGNCKISGGIIDELSNELTKKTIIVGDRTKFYYVKYLDIFYDKYNDVVKNIVDFVGKIDFFKSNSKMLYL